ncbi:MAG: amino acid adenylation domain-containing protein [Spirochaetales bacterium]|nr:amino acid adenylation domain-containing protein [Spirochaetales bacterium]
MSTFKNLIQIIEAACLKNSGITFINNEQKESSLAYSALYKKALIALAYLQHRGIKPGQKVIIQEEDNYSFLLYFWACILGGIIPVPVSPGVTGEHILKVYRIVNVLKNPYFIIKQKDFSKYDNYINRSDYQAELKVLKANIIFADAIPEINNRAAIHEPYPEDIAFIQFSSGSTGNPKGVCLTHKNLTTNIDAILTGSNADDSDSTLSWMPLTHDMGLIGLHLSPMAAGIHQYIMPPSLFIRNPLLWLEKASEHRVTVLSSPNFGLKYFLKRFTPDKAEGWDLSHVRIIFNGAEPVSPDLCRRFLSSLNRVKLKNTVMFPVYGLAEASLAVTFPPLGEEVKSIAVDRNHLAFHKKVILNCHNAVRFADLGFPVKHCRVKIVDRDGNKLDENTIGLIYIKGDNVTPGYYDDEEKTGEIIDPDGWLNTGDLGFMKDGRLIVTGRAKDIIVVNGQNYYPQDIEECAAGLEYNSLEKIAACGTFDDRYQKEIILLFVLNKKRIESFIPVALQIKKEINKRLGLDIDFIIPVKKLPRTTSGKIQRYKLVEQYHKGEYRDIINEVAVYMNNENNCTGPETESRDHNRLLTIVKEILENKNVGMNDNFFEMGGDSIKAIHLISRINEEYHIDLSLGDLINIHTIGELALYMERCDTAGSTSIPSLPENPCYEVTKMQRRLFILTTIESKNVVYNIPAVMAMKGELDYDRFEYALKKLIERHEALRTSFIMIDGEPFQEIHESVDFNVEYLEMDAGNIRDSISRFIRPFDLSKAPLIRAGLLKMKKDKHLLLFDMHHIISDGTSAIILLKEFSLLYQGAELPPLQVQYKEYAAWHNRELRTEKIEKQRMYWTGEFHKQIPVLSLPVDFARPAIQNFHGAKIECTIDPELTKRLKDIASLYNATLYMLLLAAYYILLFNYTQQQDIVVGTPLAGRDHPDVQNTVGMFVNTIALRNYPGGRKKIREFLLEIKERVVKAFDNQLYQYEMLIEDLQIKRDMGRNPLFDTMFVLQNIGHMEIDTGSLNIRPYAFDDGIAKFDLTVFARETGAGISFLFEYCTALFKKTTIQRMSLGYISILKEITLAPERMISEIELLTDDEKHSLITAYNNTKAPYPSGKTVSTLFEEQANKNPDRAALEYEGDIVTYNELNRRANQCAGLLLEKGIQKNSIIGIMADLSIEAVTAILAVLKAGCTYLPIDPGYPSDRIVYMLKDSNSRVLFTQKHLVNTIHYDGEIICLEETGYDGNKSINPGIKNKPGDLAYIMYTSGSTGTPKGVLITHKGLTNYICWATKMYAGDREAVFPLYSSLSFDLTVTSLFTPLVSGNKIIIYPDAGREFVLYRILRENKATVIKCTPSHLSLLKDKDYRTSAVKKFIVGGEDLKVSLAKSVYEGFGKKIDIYNEYGPTETVVGCMIHRFNSKEDTRLSVPIGTPAHNVQIYILNEYLKPVPKGIDGELYISGDGVAKGYINRPELTNEKFVPNPFIENKRMYKTGDRARFLENGIIEFCGRTDRQVKIHGFRIEPGEIEKYLLAFKYINDAVVVDIHTGNDNVSLCAYLVVTEGFSEPAVRCHLSQFLPGYMIPQQYVCLPEIPLTINGKLDRDALPVPDTDGLQAREYIKPGNPGEEALAVVVSQVMNREAVSMTDNFFHLGGDSIKAIQVLSQLNERGYAIHAKTILAHPVLADMAKHLEQVKERMEIEQCVCEGEIEALPIVKWFFSRDFSNQNHYNLSVLLTVKQEVKSREVTAILTALVQHHDSLRINYNRKTDTLYYNREHLGKKIPCPFHDLSMYPYTRQCEEIKQTGEALKASFNIGKDVLIKACLFHLGENGTRLLLTFHHLAVDGVSLRIILTDICLLFYQSRQGKKLQPGEKTHSLKTWARRLYTHYIQKARAQKEYWQAVCNNHFSLKHANDGTGGLYKDRIILSRELTRDETSQLTGEAHKAYGTGQKDVLITALALALHAFTGKRNVVIELESHGREEISGPVTISRTVGWFTSMYPVALYIKKDDLSGQIKSIKEQLRKIPDNGIGYGILKYITKELDDTGNQYIRFNYLGDFSGIFPGGLFELSDEESGADVCGENRVTAPVEINAFIVKNRFRVLFWWGGNHYTESEMNNIADMFIEKLREIINHCMGKDNREYTPSDFDLVNLTEDDLDTLLV